MVQIALRGRALPDGGEVDRRCGHCGGEIPPKRLQWARGEHRARFCAVGCHRLYWRAIMRQRKAVGLCPDCGEPAIPDRRRCARHLDKAAARERAARGESHFNRVLRMPRYCPRCFGRHESAAVCPFLRDHHWWFEYWQDYRAADEPLAYALYEAHIIPRADSFDDDGWRLPAQGGVLINGYIGEECAA